jgi:hypothetical protein
MVAGSIRDEFSVHLILPATSSTQPQTEMSTVNLSSGKGLLAHKADNLIPPSVSRSCGNLDVSQPCRPLRPAADFFYVLEVAGVPVVWIRSSFRTRIDPNFVSGKFVVSDYE